MATVKMIGNSGQISLGKEYAGRNVIVDEVSPGVWVIKVGEFVPDSERWIHAPGVLEQIETGLDWASKNPPSETNLELLAQKLEA